MQKFIHNVALLASIIVLSCALWQDWGMWLTVKRLLISYLGFFTIGSCLFLAFRSVPQGEPKSLKTQNGAAANKGPHG